jgi:hypothetical protein
MISGGPNLWIALFKASTQKSASSVFDIRQASTFRICQSMMATSQRKGATQLRQLAGSFGLPA